MEKRDQNFEFSQKCTSRPDESANERRSHSLYTLSKRPSRNVLLSDPKLVESTSRDLASTADSIKLKTHQNERGSESSPISTTEVEGEMEFDDGSCRSENDLRNSLKEELSRYKKELEDYNDSTRNLEEKFIQINNELNEMQKKHRHFEDKRKSSGIDSDTFSVSSSQESEHSLGLKPSHMFSTRQSFLHMLEPNNAAGTPSAGDALRNNQHDTTSATTIQWNKRKRETEMLNVLSEVIKQNYQVDGGDVERKQCKQQRAEITKDLCKVFKNFLNSAQKAPDSMNPGYVQELKSAISTLQCEQSKSRVIISQQQHYLQDYQRRCYKAQQVMETQFEEIEKLNSNNKQLEMQFNQSLEALRQKIEAKLRDVSQLPRVLREEQQKNQKLSKERAALYERIRALQDEAGQLKTKLEDMNRRKTAIMTRLKAAERDLKIFRNYNHTLKQEKVQLTEELEHVREQLEASKNNGKRLLARQKELAEKQRYELQKRILELELKVNRTQNSASSLLQERDRLIAELRAQLNTLAHNFEESQKHIRLLKRHICSISGPNDRARATTRQLNKRPSTPAP